MEKTVRRSRRVRLDLIEAVVGDGFVAFWGNLGTGLERLEGGWEDVIRHVIIVQSIIVSGGGW